MSRARTGFAALLFALAAGPEAWSQRVGLEFFEHLDELPLLIGESEAHYVSSYDRTGGNDDGFRGTHSALRVDERGEHVLFEEDGPGCVYGFWFTDGSGPTNPLPWGKLRFYFDGEEEPRIDLDGNEVFAGRTRPFLAPFVTNNFVSSGGYACTLPIPFAKQLRITSEERVGFYNVYYHLRTPAVESWTGQEDSSSVKLLFERCGHDPKPPRPTEVHRTTVDLPQRARRDGVRPSLVYETRAGGVITALRLRPLFKPDAYSLNHTRLKILFDDDEEPSVDVPVGPFFGSGLGEADVRSLFLSMSSAGVYACYLPMPFEESCRVKLLNTSFGNGGEWFVEVETSPQPLVAPAGGVVGRFTATWNEAWPIVDPVDYVLLDAQGRGKVVGHMFTVEPVHPDRRRWWEGDMRVFIDGEQTPRIHGTGHEDEAQGGWSNFWLTNPYSLPLFGEPKTLAPVNISGQINASTTTYRFWPGGIPFGTSIRFGTEHGNQNDTPANYSSVVYWYRDARS